MPTPWAERLRRLISTIRINSRDGELRVSASFGVTVIRKGETGPDALERADRLMYSSKTRGRPCYRRLNPFSKPPCREANKDVIRDSSHTWRFPRWQDVRPPPS